MFLDLAKNNMKLLSNRQEQIMSLLWEYGALTVTQVQSKLKDKLHYNTISTIIRGLETIGFINHINEYKPYSYHVVITKEQYINSIQQEIISKYFYNKKDKFIDYILQLI